MRLHWNTWGLALWMRRWTFDKVSLKRLHERLLGRLGEPCVWCDGQLINAVTLFKNFLERLPLQTSWTWKDSLMCVCVCPFDTERVCVRLRERTCARTYVWHHTCCELTTRHCDLCPFLTTAMIIVSELTLKKPCCVFRSRPPVLTLENVAGIGSIKLRDASHETCTCIEL